MGEPLCKCCRYPESSRGVIDGARPKSPWSAPALPDMGLHSDAEHGVKSLIKHVYKGAARTFTSLGDVRKAVKVERKNVVAALDGNVIMMQVPANAASFAAYTGIVTNAVRAAMGSAAVVVVVFDEPEHMTAAKREEQMRRDATRKKKVPVCSHDLFPYPTSDNYGIPELTSTTDCHAIVRCRASRQRFFDETARQVLINLKKSISVWAGNGDESVVLFDGLDSRGALRPAREPRVAQIFGSCDATAALFQRETPIGEGDLKLAWVEERVRQLAFEEKLHAQLHLTVTIDTDSIAIELMEQARRNCEPAPVNDVKGALCMRERAQKREMGDEDSHAVYWVVDYANLLEILQTRMWGAGKEPSAAMQRTANALMCAGWALAGCDFCQVKGLKADMVMDALPSLLKQAPQLVESMAVAWSGNRDATKQVTAALRRLVMLCAGNYESQARSRKATVASMREHDEQTLLKASWVASYWSQQEFTGDLTDFGFTAIYNGALVVCPTGPPPKEPKEPREPKPPKPPVDTSIVASLDHGSATDVADSPDSAVVTSKYFAEASAVIDSFRHTASV